MLICCWQIVTCNISLSTAPPTASPSPVPNLDAADPYGMLKPPLPVFSLHVSIIIVAYKSVSTLVPALCRSHARALLWEKWHVGSEAITAATSSAVTPACTAGAHVTQLSKHRGINSPGPSQRGRGITTAEGVFSGRQGSTGIKSLCVECESTNYPFLFLKHITTFRVQWWWNDQQNIAETAVLKKRKFLWTGPVSAAARKSTLLLVTAVEVSVRFPLGCSSNYFTTTEGGGGHCRGRWWVIFT